MSEDFPSVMSYGEKDPVDNQVSIAFAEEGLLINGERLHRYEALIGKSSNVDFSELRRSAAAFLLENPDKTFNQRELWAGFTSDKPFDATSFARVRTWLAHVPHNDKFIFLTFRPRNIKDQARIFPELKNATEVYDYYKVNPNLEITIVEDAGQPDDDLTKKLGQTAVDPESSL